MFGIESTVGVLTTMRVIRRVVVETGAIVIVFPLGIPITTDSMVAVQICMAFLLVSLVSILSLKPERSVASLGSIDGDRGSREFVVILWHRVIVVEVKVLFLTVGTRVMVVFTVIIVIVGRRIGAGITIALLLPIALADSSIDGERSIASLGILV